MSAWIWVKNSADLFDCDKILNSRNLILAKMLILHNSWNIVPAKLKCFTVPAIYSFLIGVIPFPEFLKYKKGVTPFIENFDDVLLITKVHIFVELIAKSPSSISFQCSCICLNAQAIYISLRNLKTPAITLEYDVE